MPAEMAPWLPTVLLPLADLAGTYPSRDGATVAACYFRTAFDAAYLLAESREGWVDGR